MLPDTFFFYTTTMFMLPWKLKLMFGYTTTIFMLPWQLKLMFWVFGRSLLSFWMDHRPMALSTRSLRRRWGITSLTSRRFGAFLSGNRLFHQSDLYLVRRIVRSKSTFLLPCSVQRRWSQSTQGSVNVRMSRRTRSIEESWRQRQALSSQTHDLANVNNWLFSRPTEVAFARLGFHIQIISYCQKMIVILRLLEIT